MHITINFWRIRGKIKGMYMYMQDHMTNDTYVIVQKRETSESRFSCSSVVVSRVWSEVKQKLLWVSARFLLGRVRVIRSQLYWRLVSLLCLLTLGACHKHLACVADALNLLYKGFRRVRGPAATQATNILLDALEHQGGCLWHAPKVKRHNKLTSLQYSWLPITRTLPNKNLALTQSNFCFTSDHTLDNSNYVMLKRVTSW